MFQRIQSLYLILAGILLIVCLCSPIGRFVSDGRPVATMYNLFLLLASNGSHVFSPWALFVLLVLVTTSTFLTLIIFHHRMYQMRLCIFNSLLLIGYIVTYVVFIFMLKAHYHADFQLCWAASLPIVSLILTVLAFRKIMADDVLVRSLNRLR